MRNDRHGLAGISTGHCSPFLLAILLIPVAVSRAETRALRELVVRRSPVTNRATFITAQDGGPIWTPTGVTAGADAPTEFLRDMGYLFGLSDVNREVTLDRITVDRLGNTHTSYQQYHRSVRVFGGVIRVHQDDAGRVRVANGDFFPQKPDLKTTPTLPPASAIDAAADAVDCGAFSVDRAELVIVDPGWYGDPPIGEHLAYYIVLDGEDAIVREAFFVDAHTGRILDQWDLTERALFRRVDDAFYHEVFTAANPRVEGDPPTGILAQNRAYDWAGDVYRFFLNAFGYDSIDGEGMDMLLTVQYVRADGSFCPNAFWNGQRSVFCPGTVTDDVLAHEVGHGITEFSADLIYQNQSGQLNESYSDIWGEMVDLYNGNTAFYGPPDDDINPWPVHPSGPGTDEPNSKRTGCTNSLSSVRWLISEDAASFGGAIRDMWAPTCMGDPDRAYSGFQLCNPNDNGGVHSGSGVPNHAFAILCDGKFFNNVEYLPIGPVMASAVWFRALTVYLTPMSDFSDAYWALNQSAADLLGTKPNDPRTGDPWPVPFNEWHLTQIDRALRAVELNTEGRCGATVDVLSPVEPNRCDPSALIHTSLFENGPGGWTVSHDARTPYDWELVTDLPFGRVGTAFFCADLDNGCLEGNESGTHTLTSPVIQLPPRFDRPVLEFTHYMASESGWDGGNLRISVNGGPFEVVPPAAILHNRYNTTLVTAGNGSTNPLAGQPAWTGSGGQWGVSQVGLDLLAEPGDSIQFQFVFGKDRCNGVDGWWVDNVLVYTCTCGTDADCGDEIFCNGVETCVEGFCERGQPPCPGRFCDEEVDTCDLTIFQETFEQVDNTNNGWVFNSQGNTASEGRWRIGRPNGTTNAGDQAQPDGAFEGGACSFTELNTTLGGGDVDGGVVYLVSPTIDLTEAPAAELSYVRWFYNRDIGEEPGDWFVVEVSDDDGATWTAVDSIAYDDPPANEWTPRTVSLEGIVDMDDGFKIRVGASDGDSNSNVIEAAIDNIRVVAVGQCVTGADCDDGDECTIDTCVALTCENTPISCVNIIMGIPASGSIDARQPHTVNDAGQRQGWQEIVLLYEGARSPATGDFTISEVGGDGVAPALTVSPLASNAVTMILSEPIEPGAWTVINHDETGWKTCLGALPGDVNGDRLSSVGDINALIDAINGVFPRVLPDSSTDMDRSTEANAQDVLRLIDLLNGASAFDIWLSRTLPPNPCD